MTNLYAFTAPAAGALAMALAIVGEYHDAAMLCAVSLLAALGAMVRSGQ